MRIAWIVGSADEEETRTVLVLPLQAYGNVSVVCHARVAAGSVAVATTTPSTETETGVAVLAVYSTAA
jgi:hypothetical protein